jgi:hypothetical protein
VKRKSEAVEVDATAEKIAKLKETAAEVVAEVSPQFPSTVLVSTWKNCNGCPDRIVMFFYASWVLRI